MGSSVMSRVREGIRREEAPSLAGTIEVGDRLSRNLGQVDSQGSFDGGRALS